MKGSDIIARPIKHGMGKERVYYMWRDMIRRCYDERSDSYNTYGGKGIKVCDEWLEDFKNFLNWANENGYSSKLQIDRIDNNIGYFPYNCRFVEPRENSAVGRRGKFKNNSSGYTGVSHRKNGKWWSRIMVNGNAISLGVFDTKEQAVKKRIEKEIELFGEQRTNLEVEV